MNDTNGQHADPAPTGITSMQSLREPVERSLLFRGFGPLVVALALFALMVALVPTVAPEQIVERPVAGARP
ncbi:MAG: hypothetical protein WD691_10485 [Acidimicrobiales bacterium]